MAAAGRVRYTPLQARLTGAEARGVTHGATHGATHGGSAGLAPLTRRGGGAQSPP